MYIYLFLNSSYPPISLPPHTPPPPPPPPPAIQAAVAVAFSQEHQSAGGALNGTSPGAPEEAPEEAPWEEDPASLWNMYTAAGWVAVVLGAVNLILFMPFIFKVWGGRVLILLRTGGRVLRFFYAMV